MLKDTNAVLPGDPIAPQPTNASGSTPGEPMTAELSVSVLKTLTVKDRRFSEWPHPSILTMPRERRPCWLPSYTGDVLGRCVMPDPGARTLADVRAAASKLRATTNAVNQIWDDANRRQAYEPDSPAAVESRNGRHEPHVQELLSNGNLLVVAALEHGDQLAKWGAEAASGTPTPVYPPWSVARSLIESCGTAAWLAEEGIAAHQRAKRSLALNVEGLVSQETHGAEQNEYRAVLESQMRELGLAQLPGMPSRADRVRALLQPFTAEKLKAYEMLSAVSHGEPWAVLELGYRAQGAHVTAGFGIARKEPPASWLWLVLILAEHSLDRAAMLQAKYRGWIP